MNKHLKKKLITFTVTMIPLEVYSATHTPSAQLQTPVISGFCTGKGIEGDLGSPQLLCHLVHEDTLGAYGQHVLKNQSLGIWNIISAMIPAPTSV